MNRHQRRKRSLIRKADNLRLLEARKVQEAARKRQKQVNANMSSPYRGKRSPRGLVSSVYSGAANPLGYTRPLKLPSKADKGASVGNVSQEIRPAHIRADWNDLEGAIRQAERLVRPPKKR